MNRGFRARAGFSSAIGALASAILAVGLLAPPVEAQSPADLGVRDKTELFIQHIVKIAEIDASKYQALVLEYEIGTALEEVLHVHEDEEGEAAADHEESPVGLVVAGFVERALEEIHPSYARLTVLLKEESWREARALARELQGSTDPYVAAHASLALAEIRYAELQGASVETSEEACKRLIDSCERILQKDRLYLIRDHRACEIVALCFQELEKSLLEYTQYAILLTDYYDLPKDVEARAKERIGALAQEVGFPLTTVADWMNQVEKFLAQELTGHDPTQRKETEVVYALDKLIELQEARERKTCSSCGGSGCRGGCQSGRPSGSRSNSPAKVSALAEAKGEFLLRGVSRGSASTIWGQLKAKEAARTLQGFKGKLPARYEKLLEQYYKNLSTVE
jgi:hypothetical protein